MEESTSFFATVEFWVLAAFVIFFIVIGKKAWVILTGILDGRAAAVRQEIEEARQLRDEAQARLAEIRRLQREAHREAEEMVAHARREAERHQKAGAEALEATLARRREQAMDKIAQAEADAVREVRRQAVDVAMAAARKVIAEDLAGSSGDALIDRAVAELPTRFH